MVRDLPQRHAAAQQAKSKPVPVPVPVPVPSIAAEPAAPVATSLSGQWSGEYRCGPYLGSGKVQNPMPWNASALMTVTGEGSATIVRGNPNYSETVTGNLQPDLSIAFKGRGADRAKANGAWNTEVNGQFLGSGQAVRFTGRAQTSTVAGELTRDCTVTFLKNPNAN